MIKTLEEVTTELTNTLQLKGVEVTAIGISGPEMLIVYVTKKKYLGLVPKELYNYTIEANVMARPRPCNA